MVKLFPFADIGLLVLQNFTFLLIHPVFWLVMGLVYYMNLRITRMEEKLFGLPLNNTLELTLRALFLGFWGGIFASLVLAVLGLSLAQIGIAFIWPVAIMLLLVNPRFLCFAYAGGIVALFVFISRAIIGLYPALQDNPVLKALLEVNLPGLLVLVALLHLVESFFIYIGGHWGSSPVFFKNQSGEIVGGFALQSFWPIPLVGMIAVLEPQTSELMDSIISMPDWWPVISHGLEPAGNEAVLFMLLPIMAGLGYADMALSSTPREKCLSSSLYLGAYSVILLALALLSVFYPVVLFPACLFAPLGHEIVILLGNRLEHSRPSRYAPTGGLGARVLSVYPDSAAREAGLKTGDIISGVNGDNVTNNHKFWECIRDSYFLVYLYVKREDETITLVLKKNGGQKYRERKPAVKQLHPGQPPPLGLILVPDTATPIYMEIKKGSLLKSLKNKFKR